MIPFVRVESCAAPLLEENVDTDIIFPARFLLITAREGLGRYVFHDRRLDMNGAERPDFVLNRAPFRTARILIAGANFGSGSSREQAVWALAGFGISCVIAPSFGEIFQANCYRNGLLAVVLPSAIVADLAARAEAGDNFVVDLEYTHIRVGDMETIFMIPSDQRLALLSGWDDTATILATREPDIAAFEKRQRAACPWLWEKI